MDLSRNSVKYCISLYTFCFFLQILVPVYAATDISETPHISSTVVPSTNPRNITENTNESSEVSSVITTPISTKQLFTDVNYLLKCPYNASCSDLGADCISCRLNHYCVYGEESTAECTVKPNITCIGEKTFTRQYHCRYGYQLDKSLYYCNRASATCTMKKAPPETYFAECYVRDDVLCLGNRTFQKKFPCNWTKGYKWSTALVLSVTLGGFGVDRFYLGLWREGIGKLFSFGGLGVWTLVDVILIAIGYVGPHDGSLYIYPWS